MLTESTLHKIAAVGVVLIVVGLASEPGILHRASGPSAAVQADAPGAQSIETPLIPAATKKPGYIMLAASAAAPALPADDRGGRRFDETYVMARD